MANFTLSKTTHAQQLRPKSKVGKKPYSPPQLIEYGDLVATTGGSGGTRADRGGLGNHP